MENSTIWKIIINPTSGSGKAKRTWPKIRELLTRSGLEFEEEFTAYHQHGMEISRKAISEGFKNLIVIGGDGTIHNVVNGIMRQNRFPSNEIKLAVIPIGTGNDWIKTQGISKDIKKAIEVIVTQNSVFQDIGLIEFEDNSTPPTYFCNLAGFGFDAFVVERVRSFKRFGGVAYLLGAIAGLIRFKPFWVKIKTNKSEFSGKILLAVAGIGQYAGGGMRLTDYSGYDSGFLDSGMAKNFTTLDLLRNLFRLFNGTINKSKKIEQHRVSYLKAEFENNNIPWVQADGELIGRGNLKISILKSALRICN